MDVMFGPKRIWIQNLSNSFYRVFLTLLVLELEGGSKLAQAATGARVKMTASEVTRLNSLEPAHRTACVTSSEGCVVAPRLRTRYTGAGELCSSVGDFDFRRAVMSFNQISQIHTWSA